MSLNDQSFHRAIQHHHAGEVAQAEALCRQIVRANPYHADAWNYLAVLAYQTGNAEAALEYFDRARAAAPGVGAYRSNRGALLQGIGRHAEAEAEYRAALALDPNHAEAHYNLATVLRVLDRPEEAVASYRRALQLRPAYPDALTNLGNVLRELDQIEEAAVLSRRAVELKPDSHEAHNNLALVLRSQGQFAESEAHCLRALELRPAFPEARYNLGNALRDLGRLTEAESWYRRSLELRENFPEAHNNLGTTVAELGRFAESEACFRRAMALKPDYADAHRNLGTAIADQGRLDEALACYGRALDLQPDNAEAHRNRALVWLLRGDFERGWPEYEWRWRVKGCEPPPFPQPFWDGAPLDGRTILLHPEQGLGDTLQFVRYAAGVKERGGTVLVQCQPPLLDVLRSCPGVDGVVPADAPLPSFDVHALLLSLPRLCGTDAATIPARVPYLAADPRLTGLWRERLAGVAGFKVGIVWQGSTRHKGDRQRSVPLEAFEPLARVPGVQLISLQVGFGIEQLSPLGNRFPVTDLGSRFNPASFSDAAAVLRSLDLVISIDTALVHLAGALGVPVWVALGFVADWRWLRDRADSPWYPTVRLFRQTRPGDWGEVFQRMARELCGLRAAL